MYIYLVSNPSEQPNTTAPHGDVLTPYTCVKDIFLLQKQIIKMFNLISYAFVILILFTQCIRL